MKCLSMTLFTDALLPALPNGVRHRDAEHGRFLRHPAAGTFRKNLQDSLHRPQ